MLLRWIKQGHCVCLTVVHGTGIALAKRELPPWSEVGAQEHQCQSSIYAPIAPAVTSTIWSSSNTATDTKPSKRRRVACKDCRQAKVSMT